MKNKLLPYHPQLKTYARYLRNNSTLSEVLLWQKIKNKALGIQFHRQVPLLNYIVDFYCHEYMLAIEIDGRSHDDKADYDARRQQELEAKGVRFIRFTDRQIKIEMPGVLRALEDFIIVLGAE